MRVASAIAAAAAVTWFLRVMVVTMMPVSRFPRAVQDVLPHVGPAVLASLVTVALLSAPADHRASFLVAAAVTAIVAHLGRSPLAALVVGLVVVALAGCL